MEDSDSIDEGRFILLVIRQGRQLTGRRNTMKKEYDFSRAKRATEISHLNRLREIQKTKVTIYLDNDVIEGFKDKALNDVSRYQTEINQTP